MRAKNGNGTQAYLSTINSVANAGIIIEEDEQKQNF